MASQVIKVTPITAVATVDGTVAGYFSVADNTKYTLYSIANLSATGQLTVEVQIVELSGTTLLGLRPTYKAGAGAPTYGRMSLVGYSIANAATLSVDGQVIVTPY